MRSVQLPYVSSMVASAARTATGTSAAIKFPDDLDGAQFILDVTAASGTTPTLDVEIQVSPDEGTTFYKAFQYAQVTAATVRRLIVSFRRVAETGAEGSIASATSSALNANVPISYTLRVRWQIGGTSPSFTFQVWAIGARGALGVTY